jgi:ankyrin repeat protein
MPARQLPSSPNLEQLKNQAGDLLKAHRSGDSDACARIQASFPRLATASPSNILRADFSLQDAQLVLAREYGFESWSKLKDHVASLRDAGPDAVEPFKTAVQEGDADGLRALFARHPELRSKVDEPWFSFDAPALVHAAGSGDRETIDVLLDHGADINLRSRWWAGGTSPLQAVSASMLSYNPELATHLIERGAVVDPLSAAGLNMQERLEALVQADPDAVHVRGTDGMTPLHLAATPEIARFLLDCGADIDARDLDHHGTPAQWAVKNRLDVCRYLIQRGAESDIFLFCALGDLDRVRAALQSGPQIVHTRTSGEAPGGHVYRYTLLAKATPLQIATRFNQKEVFGLLLNAGADIAARGEHGGTPLHWAAWSGNLNGVNLLLEHNAPVDLLCEDYGRTPLGWAVHASTQFSSPNHAPVVERLIAAGAKVPEKIGGSEAVAAVLRRHGAK